MASFLENRVAKLEQAMLPAPEKSVHCLRKKIIHEGEVEESDRDCIIRHGMDPDDASAEYSFILRKIVNHTRPAPERAEVEALLAEAPAVPVQAEAPPPPMAPPPCTAPPTPVAPPDPFEASLTEAVAKIGAGYRRKARSLNRQ